MAGWTSRTLVQGGGYQSYQTLGDINSECCEFEVQYLNEDGTVIVELYKDLKAGDIVIL